MSRYALLIVGLGLAWLAGCAAPDRRDLEYRLSKAEAERGQLQTAFEDERAKVAILRERLATAEQRRELTGSETAALDDRVRQLERDNRELLGLLERRDRAALERPDIPASPLPEGVDRQLQAFAARHQGRVWYDRGRAVVSFAGGRLFEPGSDAVHADAQRVLGELAGIAGLLPMDEFDIVVVGHTDNTSISDPATLARHPSNWHLSVHRAIAVKDTLVSAGLPAKQMAVMGYGACRPLGDDAARNRRVEVCFVRKAGLAPPQPIHVPGSVSP
jgi:chemotaxis protein MotB